MSSMYNTSSPVYNNIYFVYCVEPDFLKVWEMVQEQPWYSSNPKLQNYLETEWISCAAVSLLFNDTIWYTLSIYSYGPMLIGNHFIVGLTLTTSLSRLTMY